MTTVPSGMFSSSRRAGTLGRRGLLHRSHSIHDQGDLFLGDTPVGEVLRRGRADGNDAVGVVLVDQLVHPAARGTAQLCRYREGRVAAVNDGHMAALGRNPSDRAPWVWTRSGFTDRITFLEHFHVVLMVGAVGHAVHFHHLGAACSKGSFSRLPGGWPPRSQTYSYLQSADS